MRDDRTYFRSRAETELSLAKRAAGPEAIKAHYVLAGFYFDRAYRGSSAGRAEG